MRATSFRVPTAHREFENLAKTQEVCFSQVVTSLILRVKDILIFAAKISIFFKVCQVSFVSVIVTNHVGTGKICGRAGKKQGKHREFENAI